MDRLVADAGLNVRKFKKAMKGHVHLARIHRDCQEALALGLVSLPVFFVNGYEIPGVAWFEAVMDAAITRRLQVAAVLQELAEDQDNPWLGNESAKVRIVSFMDFSCPYSREMFPVLQEVCRENGMGVQWIFSIFP